MSKHALTPVTLDELEAIHSLTRRWETFWDAPMATTIDDLRSDLTAPFFNLEHDARGVWIDGQLVAHGRVWFRPSDEREERAFLIGLVDPEHRRQGLGTMLMEWLVEQGTNRLREAEDAIPRYLRVSEWDWIEEAFRLYRRFGFDPVRYFTEMERDLAAPIPEVGADGVDIVPWSDDLSEGARLAQNAAFADHWGSPPTNREGWEHRLQRPGTRLDLSYLAVVDQRVVGLATNGHYPEDTAVTGHREGWIESLGVEREWRGRKVASALIVASFRAFVASGFTRAKLGVDTANPTGALALYDGLGFAPTHRSVVVERRVDG